ncbi:serine/threonine-protein kinase PRP4 homolog [Chelonus insularis]|uniref:serine/threonine-protein kinase PRP4 homolog n=1 Tax=Chelonus insularis TaxID=460826 RepID=UPI00158928BC|nr:serine/threonine-protein kinase PRP4 homolog [Chelonus insularis]XP_034935125.1 serine/threonine-protein kinase PRP4 homolog [Chelonus insularis]
MTMNSDSESQDSDEGRRFRFEATRKDSHSINLGSQCSKTSPSKLQSRRSRSRDRSRYDRKDDRSSYERKKESKSSKDEKRSSKDRKSREELKKKDDTKHRDDSRHRHAHKDSWELGRKNSRPGDSRDLKNRDNRRKRSRERSYEKNRESESQKNSERSEKKHSKDREKSSRRSKFSEDNVKSRIDVKEKNPDDDLSNVDDDRISIEAQDCKELNLSDFDIVSDAEEISDSSKDEKKLRKSSSDSKDRKTKKTKRRSREKKIKSSKNGDESSLDDSHSDDDVPDVFMNNASTSASFSHSFHDSDTKNVHSKDSSDKISDKSYSDNDIDENDDKLHEDEECYGPSLPPSLTKSTPTCSDKPKIIGPCLPDNFCKQLAQKNDEDTEVFGPSLPVNTKKAQTKIIGPTLPDHLRHTLEMECEENKMEMMENEEAVEDDILGPLPADHPDIDNDQIQQQLEYRARLIKKELARMDYKEEKKREEWMTELPSVHAVNLGLGPRKFRSREAPDMSDRSEWTDTPADREKKQKEMLMGNIKPQENDREEELMKKGKPSKRDGESLLEMHQKKMHKKKKKEEKKAKKAGTSVRRPFDRDVDLQITHVDEAKKRSFIMKAQSLDDRFSRGKINK